jgi:CheY-like chemotaxis protein
LTGWLIVQLLVVEDDDLVREVVTSGLADFSFQVGEAASAEEAVRLLCCGVCPPVVVTDIDLERDDFSLSREGDSRIG